MCVCVCVSPLHIIVKQGLEGWEEIAGRKVGDKGAGGGWGGWDWISEAEESSPDKSGEWNKKTVLKCYAINTCNA